MDDFILYQLPDHCEPQEVDRTPRYAEAVAALALWAESKPQHLHFVMHIGRTVLWRRGPRVGGHAPEA